MSRWWGRYSFLEADIKRFQIGPLTLIIERSQRDWKLEYAQVSDWREDNESHAVAPAGGDGLQQERFSLQVDSNVISIMPSLADRSIVARPATPFYLPSQQKTTIYISTPLWVRISYGAKDDVLKEIPILSLLDTWFGPNTMEGELCYASQTSARTSMKNVPRRYHRAVTPVRIVNESRSHLLLERINLPVTYLELYETEEGHVWTQAVEMVRDTNDDTAEMILLAGAPDAATDASKLSESREKASGKTLIRKISGFFA